MGDGNFKAEHMKMKHPEKDVALFDGKGFLVERAPYEHHIAVVPDRTVVRTLLTIALCVHTDSAIG